MVPDLLFAIGSLATTGANCDVGFLERKVELTGITTGRSS